MVRSTIPYCTSHTNKTHLSILVLWITLTNCNCVLQSNINTQSSACIIKVNPLPFIPPGFLEGGGREGTECLSVTYFVITGSVKYSRQIKHLKGISSSSLLISQLPSSVSQIKKIHQARKLHVSDCNQHLMHVNIKSFVEPPNIQSQYIQIIFY